jgi:hypothetical protein
MKVIYDEKGKFYTDVITKETVPAIIQTRASRIRGLIHVRHEQRVKDALEEGGQYLAVTNATVYDDQGRVLYEDKFIAIHQAHIVWVIPEGDLHSEEEDDLS